MPDEIYSKEINHDQEICTPLNIFRNVGAT